MNARDEACEIKQTFLTCLVFPSRKRYDIKYHFKSR